jgi:patatin-like phospholipase/acyl hydrolase
LSCFYHTKKSGISNIKTWFFVSENKYCRDDLILNLKKKSNLSIREIVETLGINLATVTRIKV